MTNPSGPKITVQRQTIGCVAVALVAVGWSGMATAAALPNPDENLAGFMRAAAIFACRLNPADAAAVRGAMPAARMLEFDIQNIRGKPGRSVHRLLTTNGAEIVMRRLYPLGRLRRVTVEYHGAVAEGASSRPVMAVAADQNCKVFEGRRLTYDTEGRAESLSVLAPDLAAVVTKENLNPPVPVGTDPGGPLVGLVDSGVNYTLDGIRERLARDVKGDLVGFDFWDLDRRPFDVDTGRSPFFPLHHGSAVASVLLREAPTARIAVYRYPRPDMTRMATLIEDMDRAGAVIVNLAMGSNLAEDWRAFGAAASERPHMLFIVSAGNNGRDIDARPVYPASLSLDNLLVVTSADAFGRLARGSNWGAEAVDIMAPGEQVPVIDHRGAEGRASGSSFAVPRVAAMAARLLAANPTWRAADLKAAIIKRARNVDDAGTPVRHGWIPDPADDF